VIRVLSLGAGVQSTTLALMYSRGDLAPMPDCAIFADTGWEPRAVTRHLDRLEAALRFPVYRISVGNIRDDIMTKATTKAGRFAALPWFQKMPDGSEGMGRRQCTAHYKVEPIRRKVRELLGLPFPKRVPPDACVMLIGISTDEAMRARDSRVRFIKNEYPLLDQRMSRSDCRIYLRDRQWKAPKSACIGCPFHSNAAWREMRDNEPEEFADAVLVDRAIRDAGAIRGILGKQFMHRQLVPLDQADLDRGQPFDLFGNECEGMCGI
jgi:hypothetical protein